MGITSLYQELTALNPRDEATESPPTRAFQAANALYEVTFNATCPGGSAQAYQGHDHTPQGGGGPINRGHLWGFCTVSGRTLNYTAKNQSKELTGSSAMDTAHIHASPSLFESALLTGWICYYARNSDKFTLRMGPDGTTFDVELPIADSELVSWYKFQIPVEASGKWRTRNLFVECGSYDAANAPAITIYAFQIDELPDVLARRGAEETERPGATGNTILSSFPKLEDDLVAADEWFDSYSLRQLYRFENALYEGIEEKLAPGATSQVCRGHDHDSGNYGGRAIARGGCYTGTLLGATYLYRLAYDGNTYTGYYAFDYDDGTTRRSNNSVGMGIFWVGPGLTSSGNPPTNPPWLTAKVWVEWDAGVATPTMNFRALHIGSGNYSAVTTVSSTSSYGAWITIDKIPCAGDAVNEIQFELEMTGTTNTVNIAMYAFTIYEVPGVGARTNSSLPALATSEVG